MAKIDFTPNSNVPNFARKNLLRHGNIPKPLHGVTPRTILGSEWWDKERQAAYVVNNYCCWACGVHKSNAKYHQWLEAHEMYNFNWKKGRAVYKGACALCHSCHNFIHSGRLRMLVEQGTIPQEKYDDIMAHGKRVCGATRLTVPSEIQQDWSKWHLVLNGEKHYSPFTGHEHWSNHFGN